MGMDMKPINPTQDAPTNEMGVQWGRYNLAGWAWLKTNLSVWGFDVSILPSSNDGDVISEETCNEIANLISTNLNTLPLPDQIWIKDHIQLWRTCGGYEQW